MKRNLSLRKKANRDTIEWEIRNYHETKKQLEELKLDIIESTPVSDVPAQTGPGDQTYSKVMQMRTCKVILETERRLRAVEYALNWFKNSGDPARLRMIEMHYFENHYTPAGIQQRLGIGHDTFYRWRREFIGIVAERLGWEV